MPISHAVIIAVGVAALLTAGLVVRSAMIKHRVSDAVHKADANHSESVSHATKAEELDDQVEARTPQIQADTDAISSLREEVARLRHPNPGPTSSPQTPALPGLEPAASPEDLAPLVARLDLLTAAQDRKLQDQASQIITLTMSRDEWRLSAKAAQAESLQLRSALASQKALEHVWAVGGSYGTDRQCGVWVERDLGPVRVGVDIVRHPLPGGNSTLEAVARAGWSF